ncbi:MAG TPA: sugar ABC transporter ATP-binding protein [Anaeromyxobacteraceae bacterium]|nr:sugar ABC transporter ATP-binding protein [Anaeromyxobacteraceae bacterium]
MNATPVLELRRISKNFRALQALSGVDFDLRQGETHALCGENGAGKSTLMRILAGIYEEYEGEYLLDGRPVHFHSPREALRRGIGMIHQELSVMPELTVAENMFLGRQPLTAYGSVDWASMNRTAEEELAKLGFDDIDVRRPLERYPLGTQQVVEVLRAILSGARVLIMDEPTTALSPAEIERLIKLIDDLRKSSRSIVYISHFIPEVMRVADRITILRDGRNVGTVERQDSTVGSLISMILGRELSATPAPPAAKEHERVLLEVRGLSADTFTAVDLEVGAGEVMGLYGAIGAGHFEIARALFGLYRYDEGTIAVAGESFPRGFSPRHAIERGVAYAIESRRKSLFLDDAIYKNITLPHLHRIGRFVPRLAKELEIAHDAIALVGVHPPEPRNPAGKLSGGNQQKVALARWLTFPPKILIVAEPTRGMDVGAKGEVLKIVQDLADQGIGVLVASSEPETVLAVSDRIVVMSRGRVVRQLMNTDLDKDVLMRLL